MKSVRLPIGLGLAVLGTLGLGALPFETAPDLFLLPIAMRDGRSCYQVLYGRFPSEAVAEKQRKRLPASFLADRNRPKLFRFSDIPKHQ